MKGICYCALLLVCCTLFLCSEVKAIALADDSNERVDVTGESEGNKHNARVPDWVPQPSDIGRVEEQRLLAAVAMQHRKHWLKHLKTLLLGDDWAISILFTAGP